MFRPIHRILSPADIASIGNAICGLLAIFISLSDPVLAARILLLAAIADGIDGILARAFGGSPLGPYLDGLSDAVSFGVAPAVLVIATVTGPALTRTPETLIVGGAVSLYLAMALIRLSLYTAEDAAEQYTTGVPTTLAATFLAIAVLSGQMTPLSLAGSVCILSLLMITDIQYPDLRARDAIGMGSIQAIVVIAPSLLNYSLLWLLAGCALAYLVLGPHLYRQTVVKPAERGLSPR